MGFFEFLFGGFIGIIVFIILLSIYFLPTIIALLRGHRNALAIFLLNFFLGWTFFGWVVALVWSATR
jgi:hypothetical protein